MAGKRRADVELNQDNWDDEQQSQVAGTFERADKASLSNRKILSAKSRRSATQGTAGLFKSFTGFAAAPNDKTVGSFGFSMKNSSSLASTAAAIDSKVSEETDYLQQLQTLNRNLRDWINKHIDLDPHCILNPIFTDYEQHLKQLHNKYPEFAMPVSQSPPVDSLSASSSIVRSELPIPITSSASLPSTTSAICSVVMTNSKPSFSFSFPPIKSNALDPPLFRFGSSLPSSSPFATSTITSTVVSVPTTTMTTTTTFGSSNAVPTPCDDDDEEYQPPKPVIKEIKEEGSVYSTRCKLFYKWENDWKERGVGNLFIKPISDGKFQLLIRADTNLGNILLNVMVTKDIPLKLQKNNVTIVCVPSPTLPQSAPKSGQNGDTAAKPVPMLIRVKTVDEASELIKQFNMNRGLTDA